MAEPPFFSSQGSHYEQHKILHEQENLASSPLRAKHPESTHLNSQRPRKPPTITPKRFRKFFTPRETLSARRGRQSKAGRQLRDITKNGANRRRHARPLEHQGLGQESNDDTLLARSPKRRKYSIDIASSPPQSSPLKHVQTAEQIQVFQDAPTSPIVADDDALSELFDDFQPFPAPIRRLRSMGPNQRILQRSFGGYDAITRGMRGYDNCADWRSQTANFVSTPNDVHTYTGTALPFCTASCNTNSLIAIGEEEGSVRLIDSSPSSDFSTPHVTFRPHHNAVMDITFSPDDYLLATASGDQTARIVDMHTQQTVCILSGHKSSIKQVRFQPNDDNMLTTSSRDGSVMIWDLRCGGTGSVANLRTAFARNVDSGDNEPTVRYSKYTLDVGAAYRPTRLPPALSEAASVSITSIQHLPNGREHLLLTTSETNSSIKFWDLRNASRRGGLVVPLSSTPVPQSQARSYGISATALSGDGSRLYAACRDGTVYAYSSNHLVLGHAPEMEASSAAGKGRMLKSPQVGLGPLYGFKHPSLRMGSFYIKAVTRPANGDKCEMLAIGSSNNCAVLIPTDERHLSRDSHRTRAADDDYDMESIELPSAFPTRKSSVFAKPNNIPTYNDIGTALIRGHTREVTSLTWTHDGELVTISDDFTARCWREDAGKARELRGCGEGGGQRWRCGWADVDADWDQEDC